MDINIMIKTAVDNINAAVDGDAVITYDELLALYEATMGDMMDLVENVVNDMVNDRMK